MTTLATAVVAATAAAFPAGWVYQAPPAARPTGAVVVYDTLILARPTDTRWVMVAPEGNEVPQTGLCNPGDQVTLRWNVSAYAPTREMAEWLSSRISDYFLNNWLTVPGWESAAVVQDVKATVRGDESVREIPLVASVERFSAVFAKL